MAQPLSITTDQAYDGTMPVREGVASGGTLVQVKATYLQGLSGPLYRRDDTTTEVDGQGHTVTKTRWYVYDGLGSVVGEVDPSGNLTSSGTFDVYGARRSGGSTGTATTRQGFVGQLGHVTDSETGLVYMRARYYDPGIGRFVSEDPAGQGTNWFVYASDNPVNRADPTGKEDLGSLMAGMAGSAGLDALGLSTLEGITGVTDEGAYAFIEYIESTGGAGSGTFNKEMFLDFMEQFARQEGQSRVGLGGETVEGGPGEAMFKKMADILGSKVDSFSQENGISELYWLLQ